jgi:hypothetical protein
VNWKPVAAAVGGYGLTLVLALLSLAQISSTPAPAGRPEGDDKTNPTSTFYAQSRQILVAATVWNPPAANGKPDVSTIPKESLERLGRVEDVPRFPTPAKDLTAQDFRVLENGIEQKVNFLHEIDFAGVDITGQWNMYPVFGGTWGSLHEIEVVSWRPPRATYILGYTPSPLKAGECRTIQVVVAHRGVDLNRSQYCNDNHYGNAQGTSEPSTIAAQIQQRTNTPTRQSVKLSVNSYTFWSSGVLQLVNQAPQEDQGQTLPATDFTYHIEVHDARVPATVQLTAQFDLPQRYWDGSACRKHNPVVRVAGAVYKADGKVAAQFDQTYGCHEATTLASSQLTKYSKHQLLFDKYLKPTRFDTQVQLPPGDYDLRLAVQDEKSLGTARLPLHIPSFDNKDINISDIVPAGIARDSSWVLAEAISVSPFPIIPTPLVSKSLQFFPGPDPTLRRGTPLTLYFEVYDSVAQAQAPSLFCDVRITDLKTGSLVVHTGPRNANKWLIPGNAAVPIGLKIDTAKLKKGSYRVELQASDSTGRESGWRAVSFSIQ